MMHQHGGDLDAIQNKYHIPKNEIVDFSGNINPLGFPDSVNSVWQKIWILFVFILIKIMQHCVKQSVIIQVQK